MFTIIICRDYEEVSNKAFAIFRDQMKKKPNSVLGLATGSSPLGTYQRLIEDHRLNGTSYRDVVTFNLDEYIGLPEDHPQSYHMFMENNLFSKIDIRKENTHIPSSIGDAEENCRAYEKLLEPYDIDIQLLGIGSDGHIGFNEPGTPFDALTHIQVLDSRTVRDNARFFDNDVNKVPKSAITMGSGTIMNKAKKIVLIATGANKADAIWGMVKGDKDINCPASVLQGHPDVVAIIDRAAAGRL